MYEYKVLESMVQSSEKKFNELGKDGWRLVEARVNLVGGLIAVFEREAKE